MDRYFEIAGVRHEGKDGPYVLYKDAVSLETYSEMLEQENAYLKRQSRNIKESNSYITSENIDLRQENSKLKAQQLNTRLGLEKLEKLITKDYWLYPVTNNEGDLVSLGLMDPTGWEEHLSGKTLADLIDQVALTEVE